jgi:hypothetical protein
MAKTIFEKQTWKVIIPWLTWKSYKEILCDPIDVKKIVYQPIINEMIDQTKSKYMKTTTLMYANKIVVPQYVLVRFVPQTRKYHY